MRQLTPDGVDVAIDGIGGSLSFRSFRALRRGGRLVLFGHYSTVSHGRRSRRGETILYAWAAAVMLMGLLSPNRRVMTYRIAKLRDRHPDWFSDDLQELIRLWREDKLHPAVAERIPLAQARRARELLGHSSKPWFSDDLQELIRLLREDKLHPAVAERIPLAQARRAHELLEHTAVKGKLVLIP